MTTQIGIGPNASTEIGRSRLLQITTEIDRLERVLFKLATSLNELTPQHSIAVTAEAACEVANARLAIVVLPDLWETPVAFGPDSALFDPSQDVTRVWSVDQAFGGSVFYVPDMTSELSESEPNAIGATADGRTLRSLLTLPVQGSGERNIGVLCLAHHRGHAFSERQIALASALAAHLGQMIEVTEAIAEQTRISLALQTSLLPQLLPAIHGLDIAARYRPSGSGNLVGGDFYDVFPAGAGDQWYLLLGDSSGIGPEAAGLAGIARYTARALAESDLAPAEMLRLVNRAVLRATSDGRFCTAVLARFGFDEDELIVSLASAGHPPSYLQLSNGTVQTAMGPTGTVLGILDEPPIAEKQLRLSPGNALVFYTDGIIEARNTIGELFGEERLVRALAGAVGRSAEGIARRVELEVLDHCGSRTTDDVAIVVLRVPPVKKATYES